MWNIREERSIDVSIKDTLFKFYFFSLKDLTEKNV